MLNVRRLEKLEKKYAIIDTSKMKGIVTHKQLIKDVKKYLASKTDNEWREIIAKGMKDERS